MFVSESKLIVRYVETDRMGVVHHSNYPVWFEVGRTDFINRLGYPYSQIEKDGVMLPVINLNCTYKGSAEYEDEVTVRTRIKDLTGTRITFYYEIFKNSSEKLITSGETMHVFTDVSLKPVNLKKYAPRVFELLQKAKD